MEWQRGQQAQLDATVLRTDVEALHAAAVALRRNGAAIAQDYRTDQRRLEEIVNVHTERREETRTLFAEQREAWAAFAAAHPELAACSVGPDGVRHWNRAATRGAAGAAGAAAGGEAGPAPSVPVEMLGRFDAAAKQYHGCADRLRALVDALIVYEAAVWRRYCAAMRQLGDPIPADCVDQE
jgi:hypothetical protein